MDSYQNFIEILKQDISTRNFAELIETLKDGPRSLRDISVEHLESVVCSIFDKSDGLLCFLDYELATRNANVTSDNAFTEGFHFLEFFIKNFYTTSCFVQYIHQIKNVCQLALIIKCSLYIKKAACNAFIKLIELFEDHDLKLVETVDKFVSIFFANDIKERKFILCVLGKIIKHNEDVRSSQKHFNSIFTLLYSDARQKYNSNVSNDFHIYFDVLTDMLDSTEPPNKIREKLFHDMYKWIKEFSQSDRQRHTDVIRSAIDLLNRHMNLFRDLLYPDCKYWYDVLQRFSRETTALGACGRRALKTFYQIIGQILTAQNNEESRNILVYFLEEFQREFKNTRLNLNMLRLIVYGFSQMAAPCKKHMDQFNIRHMYSIITSYALPLCFNEQSHSAHIGNVCCYQEALSEMLCHMTDVTIEKINILVKLSNYAIKRFPELAIPNNALAISTLITTISNLGTINKSLLQRYLDNIIYDGIAWSCSHTLALDAELERELNNLQQTPICYKNYLSLWTELLNTKRYHDGRELMVQYVADTLMDVCITLIGRLDIRVKRINEDTVLSDVAFTQSAMNQADFRVFANVVDLYVDVIDASEPSLFVKTIHRFLQEVVRLSYKHPLISGFYKLARAGMKIFVACTSEEEEKSGDSRRMEELLSNYLVHTLDLIPTFSNELLIACLYLILEAPLAYVEDALPRTLPAFKIAFTVGLSNLELAYTALAALETWTMTTMTTQTTQKRERNERPNELLREIMAYLEPYLRSTESSVEISQDLTTSMARKRVKHVNVIDTKCTLRNFQRRVLLFFGSLDHDLLSCFVHERAARSIGASWDRKNLLKYNLPLPDARLGIHLDRTLPRIIALARDSSDRRTKIAACEVLHSMVALVVGSTTQHLSDPENRFITLYGTLCPAMLALGCDSDEVVRDLFQPLTLQVMRWLSSRVMLMSPVIPHVLDSLFDGLTDNSNPALREFSGMCLAEFTRWSIRQAPDIRETPNMQLIIRRINNLALHPSTRKRIAAAVAFNHLYTILREDDDTVSIYWLEIFYCFVRSLDGCDDPSIINALTHIEKVIRFKADLLRDTADSHKRRKPHEFDNATVTHALYWLLSQCGVLDERCRAKCMELYINLSQHIGSYMQEITQTFIETYGINRLNDIVLRGLESGVEDISAIGNVTPLLKALDCYVWLIEKQLLPVETLFPANNVQEHVIFSCIRNFAHRFWQLITESSVGTAATAMKSRELEQLQTLRCKVLMTMLNFVQVLLNVDINVLPESLWDESLSALTIKSIMHPRMVGFNGKNIEIADSLPSVLETLLNSMKSRFTYGLPDTFKKHLLSSIQEYVPKFFNLRDIAQNDSCDDLIQHVNGLILLERCGVLDRTILEMRVFMNGESTILEIFKVLVNEYIGEYTCSDLSARMIEYLRALMEFQLSQLSSTIETPVRIIPDDTRSMIETLVRLMSDDTPVISADCATIAHGEYFLTIFRSVIFKYMLAHMDAITLVFDDRLRDNPSFLLKWIEDMMLFLKQHRRELQAHVDATVDAILQQFMRLKNAVCNIDSRKERLMNIYGTAVRLKSKPTEITQNHAFRELYRWILDQLTSNNGLEYKMQILQNFLVCLTDVTDRGGDEKFELRAILRTLKTDGRSLCSDLSETSVSAMKVIDCFETLLVLLSTTRSIITLECVIHFAVGAGSCLFAEKLEEHLRRYYHGTSDENVLRSLEMTYRAFMNTNTAETERLDVLNGFLLPTFKFCDAAVIERFFERNIRELYTIAHPRLADSDDINVKQIIISKIGCFQLIAIMFANIDMDKIVGVNGTIARNALDRIETGRELFQNLFNSAKDTRSLRITRPECAELARLLHCAAYNCSLAIVSLKEEERFYSVAFGEDRARGLLIWENIIDRNKSYKLGQIFKEYPKTHETTVNIKSTINRDDQRTHRSTYVHSYDLSTSTLNEDINAYDLNRCVVLPANSHRHVSAGDPADSDRFRSHGATSVALESDDFNQHECMPYICVLLRRIKEVSGSSGEQPKWLQLFLNAMLIYNHPNIRLFMLKIISNMVDEVFKPYAKFVLSPIIKTTANYLERHNLNYIVTGILEILMDWHDVAVPNNEDDRMEAQRLFEILVDKVLIERSDNDYHSDVYNYNLSLMKNMVKKWRGCLQVPSVLLNKKIISAPKAAVHFILALLDNDMTEEIIARDDIVDFLLKLLVVGNASNQQTNKIEMLLQCLGLYLKSLDNSKRDETERVTKKYEVKQKIFAVLGSATSYQAKSYTIKQVKCVATLCRTYPEVATDYINVAISAMVKRVESSCCLEILALSMPRLSAENVVDNLRRMKLQTVLTKRMPSCEKIALQIVRDAVAVVSSACLLSYVNLAILYIKDNTTEHRELVYDILMRVYKKYSADIAAEDDVAARTLLSASVRNLLAGLLDPSQDLQDRLLKFWTEETSLGTEKSKDRLIALLAMHSSWITTTTTSEDAFAPFVALLMLQLATRSMDYTKKMFDAPLYNSCTFEDYRIAVSWRRRNLSCMTPMFVDSLASQMNYSTFSQSIDNDSRGSYLGTHSYSRRGIPLRLRATQDLHFEPSIYDNDDEDAATTFVSSHDIEFDRTTIASSSKQLSQITMTHDKRFRRFLANSSDVTNIYRHKQIQKNIQRAEMMKQENIRQRSSVRLYRNYRIGDFPDIEISHSSLIVPLQQLIKLDRLICKDVTVSVFCSLIKETIEREKSDDFRQAVVENLKQILHDSSERDSFNAIILETLLQLNVVDCNPRDIVKISKANRLNALGALLLEQSLLPDTQNDDSSPTSSKRMRRDNDDLDNEETDKWTQLASLYKSLNDVDVVLSIFRGRRSFGDDLQEAALAEANDDWIRARDAFGKAYERIENPSIKEHCLQGLLEAVNNLCDWSAIDRRVKNRANNDLNNIWHDAWKDWIIPYTCDAYVHMLAEGNWTSRDDDLAVIQSWMDNRDKLKYLKPAIGEDLVMFLLNNERQATDLLNDLLDKAGEQWIGLSPLCTELRICELLKLQVMNDLDASLKVLRCANEADYLNRMVALLNFWSAKAPTVRDNLIQWNKLAAYRTYSSTLFECALDDMLLQDDDEDNCKRKDEIRKQMRRIGYQLRLDIVDAALNQKHRYIAEKHLNYINGLKKYVHRLHLKLPLIWLEARTKYLCADIETDVCKKMSNYTASWKDSHRFLNESGALDAMNTAVRQHIGAMASRIEFLSRKNEEFASALANNTAILQNIGIAETTNVDPDHLRERLLAYSLTNLRSCCEHATATAATNVGERYCALARHCYGRLTTTDVESDELFREFLFSTLRSIYHDYLDATHYFPCLLNPERLRDEETRETFVRECAKLRPWLFLRWRDLLFSHLGTPSIASAVLPIVEKLAETYPDAVAYTYHLAVERNPGILQDKKIQRIRSLLRDKAEEYERFLQAIQYVAQPELYLKHYLDEATRDLSRGQETAIESLLRKIYPIFSARTVGEKNPRPGDIYKVIARYENEIKVLNPNAPNDACEKIRKLKESLNKSLAKRASKNRLKDYSPFLHEYTGGSIEIPGQYAGDKEPVPRYHVRIARFEPYVAVMRSLRQPIRIGMVGDNGREYKFLVKFGEDLTIDHGLQQLYATMNRTLHNDPSCRQRRLAIDTYEVVPLSRSFGLIQWIDDTRSMEDLVRFTMSKKKNDRIREKYAMWIANATSSKRLFDQYKEAVSKYNQRTVTEQMERFINETTRTALRDAFVAISPSPECFVTLRRNFVASYATMCAAHWLAGIGDRHLENTLVRIATGRCLGIDFGHAFGRGMYAPIPELVPFRLTPQILELLRPFTEQDLLATIMTHAMRALRDDRGPILACMDIFIHKPASRLSIDDDETTRDNGENIDADLIWSSKRNIEIVAKKLNGIHPSFIMLEQLKEAHDSEYFKRYYAIVMGNDGFKQARTDMRNDCLTPAEQVDCLLDQAKDLNILGRMYVNWQPWL